VTHISVVLFTTVFNHVSNSKTDLNYAFISLGFLQELRPGAKSGAMIFLRARSFHVTYSFSSFSCCSQPEGSASAEFC